MRRHIGNYIIWGGERWYRCLKSIIVPDWMSLEMGISLLLAVLHPCLENKHTKLTLCGSTMKTWPWCCCTGRQGNQQLSAASNSNREDTRKDQSCGLCLKDEKDCIDKQEVHQPVLKLAPMSIPTLGSMPILKLEKSGAICGGLKMASAWTKMVELFGKDREVWPIGGGWSLGMGLLSFRRLGHSQWCPPWPNLLAD